MSVFEMVRIEPDWGLHVLHEEMPWWRLCDRGPRTIGETWRRCDGITVVLHADGSEEVFSALVDLSTLLSTRRSLRRIVLGLGEVGDVDDRLRALDQAHRMPAGLRLQARRCRDEVERGILF